MATFHQPTGEFENIHQEESWHHQQPWSKQQKTRTFWSQMDGCFVAKMFFAMVSKGPSTGNTNSWWVKEIQTPGPRSLKPAWGCWQQSSSVSPWFFHSCRTIDVPKLLISKPPRIKQPLNGHKYAWSLPITELNHGLWGVFIFGGSKFFWEALSQQSTIPGPSRCS